jgi:hypothetical protein
MLIPIAALSILKMKKDRRQIPNIASMEWFKK